jgi:hypothetical protein
MATKAPKGYDKEAAAAFERNAQGPHANEPGYVQAEDGSWVPTSFYDKTDYTPAPEFQRGAQEQAGGNALPQGGATDLNAAAALGTGMAELTGQEGEEFEEPVFSDEVEPLPEPGNEDLKFLLGPTEHPEEHPAVGLTTNGMVAPPEGMLEFLASLRNIANRPDAPRQVKLLYVLMARRYNEAMQ